MRVPGIIWRSTHDTLKLIKAFLKCQRACFLSFSIYTFKRSDCDPEHISSQMSNIAMVSHWSWPHLFWIMTDFWTLVCSIILKPSVSFTKNRKEICTSLLNRFEEMPITFNQHSLNTYSLVRSRCSTYLFSVCIHFSFFLFYTCITTSHLSLIRGLAGPSLPSITHTHTHNTRHTPRPEECGEWNGIATAGYTGERQRDR